MSLYRNNQVFCILWTMTFIIFYAYFFFTSSIVAFEDAFVETVQEKGYPSDFEEHSKWKLSYYLLWSLSWLPNSLLKKIELKINDIERWIERKDSNNSNADGEMQAEPENINDHSFESELK
jgi:hypothetical protein